MHIYRRNEDSGPKLHEVTRVVLYLFFLLLLMPDIFRINHLMNLAFTAVRGMAGLLAILLLLDDRNHSKSLTVLIIYIVYLGIVTILRDFKTSNLIRFVAIYADIFILAVYTEYLIKKDTRRFISFLFCVLLGGLIINTASVFLFPRGMLQVANEAGVTAPAYFYDYDNHFIIRYIPTVLIVFIYEKYMHGRPKGGIITLLCIIVSAATLLFLRSSASMIAWCLVAAAFICIDMIPADVFDFFSIWIGYVIISIILIAGNISTAGTEFIEKLGKAKSLFKRTRMWGLAVKEVAGSPLVGTGVVNASDMRELYWFAQLHNSFINILLWSGIIGVLLYTAFVLSLKKDMNKWNANNRMVSKFISVLFMAVMVASLFDGLELRSNLYLFYFIVANYNYIEAAFKTRPERDRIVNQRLQMQTGKRNTNEKSC